MFDAPINKKIPHFILLGIILIITMKQTLLKNFNVADFAYGPTKCIS